jgi:hypothetical protein
MRRTLSLVAALLIGATLAAAAVAFALLRSR